MESNETSLQHLDSCLNDGFFSRNVKYLKTLTENYY